MTAAAATLVQPVGRVTASSSRCNSAADCQRFARDLLPDTGLRLFPAFAHGCAAAGWRLARRSAFRRGRSRTRRYRCAHRPVCLPVAPAPCRRACPSPCGSAVTVSSRPERRQSEIQNLDAGFRDHDVARLQIAMNDALAVRLLPARPRSARRKRSAVFDGKRSALQPRRDRLALHQFHHQVVRPDVVEACRCWGDSATKSPAPRARSGR